MQALSVLWNSLWINDTVIPESTSFCCFSSKSIKVILVVMALEHCLCVFQHHYYVCNDCVNLLPTQWLIGMNKICSPLVHRSNHKFVLTQYGNNGTVFCTYSAKLQIWTLLLKHSQHFVRESVKTSSMAFISELPKWGFTHTTLHFICLTTQATKATLTYIYVYWARQVLQPAKQVRYSLVLRLFPSLLYWPLNSCTQRKPMQLNRGESEKKTSVRVH